MAVGFAGKIKEDVARVDAEGFSEECQFPDALHAPDNFGESVFEFSHFGDFAAVESFFADRIEIEREGRFPYKLLSPAVAVVEHKVSVFAFFCHLLFLSDIV